MRSTFICDVRTSVCCLDICIIFYRHSDTTLGPQRKQESTSSLQFSFMDPRLYVNTSLVDVGKRPVTGIRLYLEGKRSNRLAIHMQHLSSLPKVFQLHDDPNENSQRHVYDRKYYEKVQWKNFSHVCTAPVESGEDLSIVTGAHFQVGDYGMKTILFLRLRSSWLHCSSCMYSFLFRPDAVGLGGLTPLHIAASRIGSESMLDVLTYDPGLVYLPRCFCEG